MKIGIFLPNATFDLPGTPEVGGIETFSFVVGEALVRLGHEVVLFGGEPKAGRTHRATTLPLELHPYWETRAIPDLGTRFQRLVQRLHFGWSIRRAWREQACDAVLLAKPFDWPVAWFWKRRRPELRTIMGFQGTDFFAGDRLFYSAVDRAFAVSPRVADLAEARTGRRPVFISNPVETELFCPDGEVAPAQGAHWRLVGSGRQVGWKGFASLIEALAVLRDRDGIDAELRLAGEGPEQIALRAQIERLELGERVTLCGRLDGAGLRDLFRAGELYVTPSIGLDACPISTLEAGSTGLPLLLSSQVGIHDFLDEEEAVSYPAGEVAALTDALARLYRRRHEKPWTDRAARHARMCARFSPEAIARQILELIGST